MSYHHSLESILDTPEIRKIKKLPLPKQREFFKKSLEEAFKKLPKSNTQEQDIFLENNSFLRHYKPIKPTNKTILFIHGGGWSVGCVDSYGNVCRYLCENGQFNVFSLEYSLAPEYKFPIGVNQALYAYDWLCNNADNLNICKDNIIVMGDSAGGTFATVICNENQKNLPKAQILIYPSVDMYNNYKSHNKFDKPKYHLTMEWSNLFREAYLPNLQDEKLLKNPKVSPIFYENTKQPNTMIIAVTHDILIDSIFAYENKLKNENVNVQTYYDYEMFHGFISTIGISPLPNAKIALEKIINYINNL